MTQLLKPGGLVFLDDVSPVWKDIEAVYAALDEGVYTKLGSDGRIGMLRKRPAQ